MDAGCVGFAKLISISTVLGQEGQVVFQFYAIICIFKETSPQLQLQRIRRELQEKR